MPATIESIEEKIRKNLSDFTQGFDKPYSGIFSNFYKFSIRSVDYDKLRLLRYILGPLLGFKVFDQPFEKINWEIPFLYKDVPCSAAHQKFGFRIYVGRVLPESKAQELYDKMIVILTKALSSAEQIIRTSAKNEIDAGKVIVENQLSELAQKYEFFRDQSRKKAKYGKKLDSLKLGQSTKKPLTNINKAFRARVEATYYEQAAYMAFYSMLEHLCVLALAFRNQQYSESVLQFTKLNWSEKFKVVFPIQDQPWGQWYNYLFDLAKIRRNPSAHGYLGSMMETMTFWFEPARHKIPVSVYDGQIISKWRDGEGNLNKLDEFLDLIRESQLTKNMMHYLENGFPVSFRNLDVYRTINGLSDEELKEYVEAENWKFDNAANMDW